VGLSSIKQIIRKEDAYYDVYKKNHPVIPKQVINVADLRYRGVEKDFQEQLSALLIKKGRSRVVKRRKRV
jgi:hypothetical protein